MDVNRDPVKGSLARQATMSLLDIMGTGIGAATRPDNAKFAGGLWEVLPALRGFGVAGGGWELQIEQLRKKLGIQGNFDVGNLNESQIATAMKFFEPMIMSGPTSPMLALGAKLIGEHAAEMGQDVNEGYTTKKDALIGLVNIAKEEILKKYPAMASENPVVKAFMDIVVKLLEEIAGRKLKLNVDAHSTVSSRALKHALAVEAEVAKERAATPANPFQTHSARLQYSP
jgi:hypothetical protein